MLLPHRDATSSSSSSSSPEGSTRSLTLLFASQTSRRRRRRIISFNEEQHNNRRVIEYHKAAGLSSWTTSSLVLPSLATCPLPERVQVSERREQRSLSLSLSLSLIGVSFCFCFSSSPFFPSSPVCCCLLSRSSDDDDDDDEIDGCFLLCRTAGWCSSLSLSLYCCSLDTPDWAGWRRRVREGLTAVTSEPSFLSFSLSYMFSVSSMYYVCIYIYASSFLIKTTSVDERMGDTATIKVVNQFL